MPRHKEGYVSERIAELMREPNGESRNILEVCQETIEAVRGSSWCDYEYKAYCDKFIANCEVIHFYILHWVDKEDVYDYLILQLLERCLFLARPKLKELHTEFIKNKVDNAINIDKIIRILTLNNILIQNHKSTEKYDSI